MATITPLCMLRCFVRKLVPHLSFSNPPLPLWIHTGIFFVLLLCVQFSLVGSVDSYAEPLKFGINTAEGGLVKPRYQAALERWLLDQGCKADVVAQLDGAQGDLVFDVRADRQGSALQDAPLLVPIELTSEDLDSVWVIRRTALGGGIESLIGERVALLSELSLIGYQRPLAQLAMLGVTKDQLTVLHSDQYQGVMTLLLHGDVFAAAIPRVFAQRWLESNGLAILYEPMSTKGESRVTKGDPGAMKGDPGATKETQALQVGIWATPSSFNRGGAVLANYETCVQALTGVRRSGRRDLKMRLFPEWVTGFTVDSLLSNNR